MNVRLIIMSLLLVSNASYTMQIQTTSLQPSNHSSENIQNSSAGYDDKKIQFVMPCPLFIHVYVQATKETKLDPTPLKHLLDKVKKLDNLYSVGKIGLTEKDWKGVLLSRIPCHSCQIKVNGKIIKVEIKDSGYFFEKEITSDYDVTSDPYQHATIVNQFKTLIKNSN